MRAEAPVGVATTESPAADGSPLASELDRGPFRVGFRLTYRYHAGRVERPEVRLDGTPETRPIARRMQLGLWYPAAPNTPAVRLRLRDYVDLADRIVLLPYDRRPMGVITAQDREALVRSVFTRAVFQGARDSAVRALLDTPVDAFRAPPPAAGRFPLVVIAPGSGGSLTEHAITAEYLASHGYVVVGMPTRGNDPSLSSALDLGVVESQVSDMEYAIAFAAEHDFVDARRLGLFTHSWSSMSAIVLAARNPSVDAVVSLDGNIVGGADARRLSLSPLFAPTRVTAPVLLVSASRRAVDTALVNRLPYAHLTEVLVRDLHHLDYADFAVYHTALDVLPARSALSLGEIRQTHAWIDRYSRLFLDAHVKQLPAARAAVEADPRTAGAPATVVAFERRPGRPAPPAGASLYELIWERGGIERLDRLVAETRRRDPGWVPFPERVLLTAAAQRTEMGLHDDATALLAVNVQLFPRSSAAHAALGESQLRLGRRAAAVESLRRAVELDATNTAAAARLRELER